MHAEDEGTTWEFQFGLGLDYFPSGNSYVNAARPWAQEKVDGICRWLRQTGNQH